MDFWKDAQNLKGLTKSPNPQWGFQNFDQKFPKSPIFCKIWNLGNWGFGDFLLGICIFILKTPQIPNSPNCLLSLENAENYWGFWFYTRRLPESPNPQWGFHIPLKNSPIPQIPKFLQLYPQIGLGDLGIFSWGFGDFSLGDFDFQPGDSPNPQPLGRPFHITKKSE